MSIEMLRIILTLMVVTLFPMKSYAQDASAMLPIKVSLIQCGETQADIPKACKADARCCVFSDGYPSVYTHKTEKADWEYKLAQRQKGTMRYIRKDEPKI